MKKNNKDLTPQEKLTHNPFAALKAGNGRSDGSEQGTGNSPAPEAPKETGNGSKISSPKGASFSGPGHRPGVKGKVVLRMERKGHGGKEMTRIEKLSLTSALLETWLKEIKQSLGCGGVIDGEDLLIQGDQRDRLAAFFTKKGIVVQS